MAGNNKATKMPIIAITTSSSTRVKPNDLNDFRTFMAFSFVQAEKTT